ncbi:hypothetical protein T492DRAFT_1108407, partial [Pavlovales sp. CCMP2436]
MVAKRTQVIPVSEIGAGSTPPPADAPKAAVKARGKGTWGVVRSTAAPGQSTAPRKSMGGRVVLAAGEIGKALTKQQHPCAQFGFKFLESAPVTIVMMLATFWSLAADDIRVAAEVGIEHDRNFMITYSVCFFLFAIEVIIGVVVKPRYTRTAYFYFDVIATLSLLTELPWVINIAALTQSSQNAASTNEAASAARTVRLLRVVRLVRLVRVVKLYKYAMQRGFHRAGPTRRGNAEAPDWKDNPSAVGRALQESITLQVVVGVLLMLIVFPLISVTETRIGLDYDLELVDQVDRLWRTHRDGSASAGSAAYSVVKSAVDFQSLAYFETYDGTVLFSDPLLQPPNVRAEEYAVAQAGARCLSVAECSVGAFFKRRDLMIQSEYSLGLLAFVLVLLVGGVMVFNRIANKYCIAPIEKLFALVNSFAKDPMAKLGNFENDSLDELYELEQSIRKIASLLQVGIGLAGKETIARCLRTTGDINPIAVGIKVNCLFGFCDIRQFTDATECLQEQVMLFTNSVGHIVHHAVHDCGGFANKNIGDAFLVAWTGDKLERRIAQVQHSDRNKQIGAVFVDNELELAVRDKWAPTVGDLAMASFIRLTICVRGATALSELVQNPALQKRLPGYTVRLGCGLHVGWAIEGALGTQKKIDATYLSPATNIAMGLESATKQYGNLLLVSQETYKLFSPFVRQLVRKIDCVFATAGADPFDLYTYDCSTSLAVHPDEAKEKAMAEHVFDYPLAITPAFRAAFAEGLEFYLQ